MKALNLGSIITAGILVCTCAEGASAYPDLSERFPRFACETSGNRNELLRQADELFEAGFYDKAISGYRALLESQELDLEVVVIARFHLALAYMSEKRWVQAVTALKENVRLLQDLSVEGLEDTKENSLYLLGLASSYLKDYPAAIDAFKTYCRLPTKKKLRLYDEAQFELGILAYDTRDYSLAVEYLIPISE